ncbi:MAG: hypothetical protein IK130_02185 [Oscillospiraceae bacterium]|nr:hypothetical protein [Oscillospiraceae bacterium]
MKPLKQLFAVLCAGALSLPSVSAVMSAQAVSQNISADDYNYYSADHYAPLWGDVNMDNAIHWNDVYDLQQLIDGTFPNGWFTPSVNADVDGNGVLDEKDVQVLQRWCETRAAGVNPDKECAAEKNAWRSHYGFPHLLSAKENYSIPAAAFGRDPGVLTFTLISSEDTWFTYSLRALTMDDTGYAYWQNLTDHDSDYWDCWRYLDSGMERPAVHLEANKPYTVSINVENLPVVTDSYYTFRIFDISNSDAAVYLTGVGVTETPAADAPYQFSFGGKKQYESTGGSVTVPVSLEEALPYSQLKFTVRYPSAAAYDETYFSDQLRGLDIAVERDDNAHTLTYTLDAVSRSDTGTLLQMHFTLPEDADEIDGKQMFELINVSAVSADGDAYRGCAEYAQLAAGDVKPAVTTGFTVSAVTGTTSVVTTGSAKQTDSKVSATTSGSEPAASSATTPTTAVPDGPRFVWGEDNWSFDNTNVYFQEHKYRVSSAVQNVFMRLFPMSDSDNALLRETVKYNSSRADWGGSCFGMTLGEILVKQDILDLTDFGGDAVLNRNENTDEMLSLINLLQAMQGIRFSQSIRQSTLLSNPDTVPQEKYLKRLEETLKEGRLVKVGLTKRVTQLLMPEDDPRRILWGNHAILAYGLEECSYTSDFTGKSYDRKILVADPNKLRQNKLLDSVCIYYNSKDYSWIIPEYCSESTRVRYACYWNSGSEYKENGYINNLMTYESADGMMSLMSDYAAPNYIAGAEFTGSDPQGAEMGIVLDSGDPALDFSSMEEGNIILCDLEFDEDTEKTVSMSYALANPTSRYYLAYADKYSDYNVRMDYENAAYFAKADSVRYMEFAPEGEISLNGSSTDYDITLVTDPALCTTDWYTLRVTGGKADKMALRCTEGGYLFYADNMENITVSADNGSHRAAVTFSAETPCAVMIYEINADTLGVKADTDGDGVFETPLETERTSLLEGDINCDGRLSVADAVLLAKTVAEDTSVSITANGMRNAELDCDGILTAGDVQQLLRMIAKS